MKEKISNVLSYEQTKSWKSHASSCNLIDIRFLKIPKSEFWIHLSKNKIYIKFLCGNKISENIFHLLWGEKADSTKVYEHRQQQQKSFRDFRGSLNLVQSFAFPLNSSVTTGLPWTRLSAGAVESSGTEVCRGLVRSTLKEATGDPERTRLICILNSGFICISKNIYRGRQLLPDS